MLFWAIPAVIFYIIVTLWVAGLLLCSVYAHYSRMRSGNIQKTQSETDKSEINQGSKRAGQIERVTLKRRLANSINLYCYGLCRYYSILIGKIPSQRIRNFLMRKCLCLDISPKAVLYGGFEMRSPWNIHIGEAVIGVGALLDGRRGIWIDNRVCLAQNVKIFTLQHDVNDVHFAAVGGGIKLEQYSWISSGTTILPGLTVGKGAVLASGAIATKDLEPYGVYAGIPAKKITERNQNLDYETCHGYWHFY